MKIRVAQIEDAPALNLLLEAAFLDYVRGLGKEWPGPYDWLEPRLVAQEVYAATEAGQILGALVLSQDAAAGRLTVDILAVAPEAQGRGVGRALLAFAEGIARRAGHRDMALHTVAKYTHLVGLYESVGFTLSHLGSRPKGDDGFPRAFMIKSLAEEAAAP